MCSGYPEHIGENPSLGDPGDRFRIGVRDGYRRALCNAVELPPRLWRLSSAPGRMVHDQS